VSTALKLLKVVWENGTKDSWERVNHSMRNALTLAIGSGLDFAAKDFGIMASDFSWSYWATDDPEWIYHHAILNGNQSCVEAWEKYQNRSPFRANDVSLYRWEGAESDGYGYLHTSSVKRQRERLAVGFGFPIDGRQWWVTKFDDDKGVVRLASYKGDWPGGKPEKLRVLTHEELSVLCPAHKHKQIAGADASILTQ
jgi:hypothetical protein